MKKLFVALLVISMLTLAAVPAFAANTTYICPNGNTACVQNGACLTDGSCVNHGTCIANGVCQNPEGCPNGGVPKRDGTGNPHGVHGGGHSRGNGHYGGGHNH